MSEMGPKSIRRKGRSFPVHRHQPTIEVICRILNSRVELMLKGDGSGEMAETFGVRSEGKKTVVVTECGSDEFSQFWAKRFIADFQAGKVENAVVIYTRKDDPLRPAAISSPDPDAPVIVDTAEPKL